MDSPAAARRPRWSRTARRVAASTAACLLALGGLGAVQTAASPPTRAAAPAPAAGQDAALPHLRTSGAYVMGISSGGYMATQLQVAHSSRFRGAAIYSAGPYWCARGTLALALESCTGDTVPITMQPLYDRTDAYAATGAVDPTANLARSRTWLFHGTRDTTVGRSVADHLAEYYRHYGTPLTYRDTTAAGHAWISRLGPVPCDRTAAPYINDCSPYDAQADSLRTVLGSARAPGAGEPKGRVTAFSQDRYAVPASAGLGDPTRTGAAAVGMGATGYLYAPPSCARGARCALVVALHGCQQTAEQIGTTFVERSGLNSWADANGFVVLYPQARPDAAAFGNPKGCWDWWGYLGPRDDAYATKAGPQMRTVMRMISALGG